MAKKARPSSSNNTNVGMMLVTTYFMLWLVNSLVIYFANVFFPQSVVLGTYSIKPLWALLNGMGLLALIGTLAVPVIHVWEQKRSRMLSRKEWFVEYFLLNFVALWVIARLADQLGLGISSWRIVAILALVLGMVQSMAIEQVKKMRLKI